MSDRLLIAIPTTDYIPADFVKSLAKLQQELGRRGVAYDVEIQSGTLVYIVRNRLANKAINEHYSRVLWIDSDMVFNEKVYEDLADVGKEMVCGAFVSRRPPYGPCIYTSIEENAIEKVKDFGIRPFRVRLFVYAYMGLLSGIAGIVYVSQVKCMYPNALVGDELSVIAAAVIGGTKLSGGQGKLLGAFLGVMIVHILNNTLIYLGLTSSWNDLFIGALMIISVATTAYQERLKNRKHFIFTE
jgi:simple sugar transport system permease protein